MADTRYFFKMDVGYLDNPKICELIEDHPHAILLHVFCIGYSKQHGTNGRVPMRLAMRRACAEQCDLDMCLALGLLTMDDYSHLLVHDYLEHQSSAEEDKARSDKGKRAAEARWSGAKGNAPGNAPSIPGSNATGNADEMRRDETLPTDPDRPDVDALCAHLADRIVGNGSKKPTIGKTWKDDARLLIDRDKRDLDEAHRLIDWCQDDSFWKSNILSMSKFRKQYDQIRMKARMSPTQTQPSSNLDDLDLLTIQSRPTKGPSNAA